MWSSKRLERSSGTMRLAVRRTVSFAERVPWDLYTARSFMSVESSESVIVSEDVKRMADLLKSGATMLSDVCPECGSPLFKVRGDILCAKCNKPVVYARAIGPEATVPSTMLLDSVEQTIVTKITEINELLKLEKDPERLSAYSNLVFGWLSMLEKIHNLKETLGRS
jgi:UPF0148 protein